MQTNLTGEARNALHWAAAALGMKQMNEANGDPLRGDSLAAYERYQDNARAHGLTDADIRNYYAQLAAT
ncbi:hypothetical protein [Streptomyces sp. NPDC059649]|uniref:hypothetical protein n=1 Tax=Streptomyces sp. NPDC059649 TaxID=3346895 RepID=UPI00369172BD